jgi:tetratricopeptide (TPR) repeat protein
MKKVIKYKAFFLPFLIICGSLLIHSSAWADSSEKGKTDALNLNRSYEALYAIGYLSERSKNYEKALEYYKAANLKKTNEKILTRIANLYMKMREVSFAEQYAEKAIQINNRYLPAYFILADINSAFRSYDKTKELYKKILEINPDEMRAHYRLAWIYQINKDLTNAKKHYQAILNIYHRTKRNIKEVEYAAISLGNIYLNSAEFEIALRFYKKAYNTNPGNITILERLGKVNFVLRKYQKALSSYDTLFSYFPGNVHLASMIAQIHFIFDETEQMKKYLGYADFNSTDTSAGKTASSKSTYTPKVIEGLLLLDKEKFEAAEEIFQRLIRVNPNDITANYALSKIYRLKNRPAQENNFLLKSALILSTSSIPWKSERILKKLLIVNPDNQQYKFFLGRIYEVQKMHYRAIAIFDELTGKNPKNSELLFHLSYLYNATDQFTKAHEIIVRALAIAPHKSKLHFLQGSIFSRENKFAQALSSFQKAIKIDDKKPEYHFYLAATYDKLNKLPETIEALKKTLRLDPKNGKAYNFLGYLYAENNINLDESIHLILHALDYDPENAAYQDSLGWAYYKMGKFEDAHLHVSMSIRYFQEKNDTDPVVYDHLGDIQVKRGKIKSAIQSWQKGIKIYSKEGALKNQKSIIRLKTKITSAESILKGQVK